jgi:hypothetical protein
MIDREAKVPITARAVELFQRALAIKAGGDTRHRELASSTCNPCILFPLDLQADQPPPSWTTDAHQTTCWNHVADLRHRLDAAAAR